MDKLFVEMDIGNQKELLRIYENNLKNAKTDSEKEKINKHIEQTEAEISKLVAEEKAL